MKALFPDNGVALGALFRGEGEKSGTNIRWLRKVFFP
jgi:hypothetical protein